MFNKIKAIYNSYRPLSGIILVPTLVLLIGSVIKGYTVNISQLSVIPFLGSILANSSAFILECFGFHAISKGNLLELTSGHIYHLRVGISYMSIYHVVFVLIAISFLKTSIRRKLLFFFCAVLFFYLINTIRTISVVIGVESFGVINIRPIREFFQLILNVFVLFFGVFWIRQNYSLKKLVMSKFGISKFNIRQYLKRIIITLIFLFAVKYFVNSDMLMFGNRMAYSILWFSKLLLAKLGYVSELYNFRYIYHGVARIRVADACLGINLMLAFGSFIAIITGKWYHKIWYITLGLIIIYFLNVLRMSLLFIYLTLSNGKYATFLEIHDVYNYTIYILTFVLWVVWINKFSKTAVK